MWACLWNTQPDFHDEGMDDDINLNCIVFVCVCVRGVEY